MDQAVALIAEKAGKKGTGKKAAPKKKAPAKKAAGKSDD
jgi:DNA topoisomerase-1